jgi:cytochrome P450
MEGVITGLQMQQFDYYYLLTLLKPFIPKSVFKPKEDMDRYTEELVARRAAHGYLPGRTDVFNYLLSNKNPEDQLSKSAMYENGITLVVAGSETTATLLTGVTYFLCKNPEALRKVREEVRGRFQRDEEITLKAVNELQYVLAVLNESLRAFPPSPFGIPRIVSGDQMVAGYFVKKGVRICSHFPVVTAREAVHGDLMLGSEAELFR